MAIHCYKQYKVKKPLTDTTATAKLTKNERAYFLFVVYVVFANNFVVSANLMIYIMIFVNNFVVSSNRAHNLSFLFCGLGLLCGEEAGHDGGQGHPRGDEEEAEGGQGVTQGNYKVGNFCS